MEPNEETAPNVRSIFELARDGYSSNETAKALFDRGILTPGEYKAAHGCTAHDVSRCRHIWQKSAVLHILNSERYIGTYIRAKLAREVVGTGGLTARLADTLIDRLYVYPGHQLDIVWKMRDFFVNQ